MAITRYLGFGKETSHGTAVAATVFCDPESVEMDPSGENIIVYKSISGQDNIIAHGNYMSEGSFTIPYDEKVMAWLAKWMLTSGADGYTVSGSGTYTHTIKPATASPLMQPITVRVGKDILEQYFAGCAIDKLSIDAKPGDFVKCQFDLVGGIDASASLNNSYTYTTGSTLFSGSDLSIDITSTTPVNGVDITGHTRVEAMKLSLGLNTDAEGGITLGGRSPRRIFRGALDIQGELTLSFDDATELKRFWGNSNSATGPLTTIEQFNVGINLGTTCDIIMPRVIYTNVTQPVSGRDRIVQTAKFTALRSADGATEPISFVFVNNIVTLNP